MSVADVGRMTKTFGDRDRDELVAAVKRGERVAAAASRFGVTQSTAYTWIRRAREAEEAATRPRFLELVTADSGSGLIVRVGSAEIDLRPGFDAELLRAVVAALGAAP